MITDGVYIEKTPIEGFGYKFNCWGRPTARLTRILALSLGEFYIETNISFLACELARNDGNMRDLVKEEIEELMRRLIKHRQTINGI